MSLHSHPVNFAGWLFVFRKTFGATHCPLMPKGWEMIIAGYLESGGDKAVVKQMERVAGRVRYH